MINQESLNNDALKTKAQNIIKNINIIIEKYNIVIEMLIPNMINISNEPLLKQLAEDFYTYHNSLLIKISSQTEANFKNYLDYNDKLFALIKNTLERSVYDDQKLDNQKTEPLYPLTANDKRFSSEIWQQNPFFDFVRQFYSMTSEWMSTSITNFDLDNKELDYTNLIPKCLKDYCCPVNYPFLNPDVLQKIYESDFTNIIYGLDNLINDLKHSTQILPIKTVDDKFFEVGKNLAITKGKIIYQNELIQLICYEPCNKSYLIPTLICPPWINKYYILDLNDDKSFVKWLIEQNHQVYLI